MKKQFLLFILTILLLYGKGISQPVIVRGGFGSLVGNLTNVNNTLYFTDLNYLYKSNGTNESTILLYSALHTNISNLTNINGTLYFTIYNDAIDEASIWKSNGTPAGTVPVKKFPSTLSTLSEIVSIGSTVYFGHEDKLYKTDGTDAGTILIKDLHPETDAGSFRLTVFQNKIFIKLGILNIPDELWQSNGTATGTTFIRTFKDFSFAKVAGSYLYMVADDGNTGKELWKTDSNGNVSLVKDIISGPQGAFLNTISNTESFNNQLYFATEFDSGIWKTDGTAAGTIKLHSFNYVLDIKASTSFVYFISGDGLGKTDGTTQGTVIVKQISALYNSTLTTIGNQAFVVAEGKDLWQSDGTADATVRIVESGNPELNLLPDGFELANIGGVLYFFERIYDVSDPEFSFEYSTLYKYDPNQVWIPSFTLINTDTDTDIRYLKEGDTLYTDQHITLRADAPAGVKSVKFFLNDIIRRTEAGRPFALAGDINGNYTEWQKQKGNYKISGVPFAANGSEGNSLVMNFIVLNPQDTINNNPGEMLRIILVNAQTDTDIRDLKNIDTVRYNPSSDQITVRAVPKTAAGSILFYINGSLVRSESAAPYAIKGDNNGDYTPWNPAAGTYSIMIKSFSGSGGGGTLIATRTITLTVITQTVQPQITFTLVNAVTNQDIGSLINNQVINLAQTGNKLNIRANSTMAGTKSVVFDYNNTSRYKVENTAPYSLFGDNNGDYSVWSPAPGTYVLTATPYQNTGGTGVSGVPLSITFYVTGTAAAKVVMFPNPAADDLTISIEDGEMESAEVSITDEKGKEYYKNRHSGSVMQTGLDINLQSMDMNPGIYFVKIQNDKDVQVYKIIKK